MGHFESFSITTDMAFFGFDYDQDCLLIGECTGS